MPLRALWCKNRRDNVTTACHNMSVIVVYRRVRSLSERCRGDAKSLKSTNVREARRRRAHKVRAGRLSRGRFEILPGGVSVDHVNVPVPQAYLFPRRARARVL